MAEGRLGRNDRGRRRPVARTEGGRSVAMTEGGRSVAMTGS